MLALANARTLAESLTLTPDPSAWLRAFPECTTLAQVLDAHAEKQPDKRLYTFLDERGRESEFVTYKQFQERVRSVAAEIMEVCGPKERALLLFEPGPDYMVTFFACLAAGVVAVPAYPPEPHRAEWGLGRLNRIVTDAEASIVFTSESMKNRLQVLLAGQFSGLRTHVVNGSSCARKGEFKPPAIDAMDAAFLQYTSGSTAEPRGVIVTHNSLMANERMIAAGFSNSSSMVVVSWLPFYHDMGLIGNMLQPVFVGGQCIVMSPTTFLRQPLIWLQAISRYRATTSGAPNFGYEACLQRIGDDALASLDLSSWQVAYCGAEPIREATLSLFAERFRSAGFDARAFSPCYGMAEATLLVSTSPRFRGAQFATFSRELLKARLAVRDPEGVPFASCGPAIGDEVIAIVDPETREVLTPGHLGEIWLRGPHIGAGYFGHNSVRPDTFTARDTTGAGPYLRTGDVGFLQDGLLYVADRLRDLINIGKDCFLPQQLELSIELCDPALAKHACVAFAIQTPSGTKLGIAVELTGKPQRDLDSAQIFANVLHVLQQEHRVSPTLIALCRRGSLPRTSSGKLQRHLCQSELQSERLQPQWLWRAAEAAKLHAAADAVAAPAAQ